MPHGWRLWDQGFQIELLNCPLGIAYLNDPKYLKSTRLRCSIVPVNLLNIPVTFILTYKISIPLIPQVRNLGTTLNIHSPSYSLTISHENAIEFYFWKICKFSLNASSHQVCIILIASEKEFVHSHKKYFCKKKPDLVISPIKNLLLSEGRNIVCLM